MIPEVFRRCSGSSRVDSGGVLEEILEVFRRYSGGVPGRFPVGFPDTLNQRNTCCKATIFCTATDDPGQVLGLLAGQYDPWGLQDMARCSVGAVKLLATPSPLRPLVVGLLNVLSCLRNIRDHRRHIDMHAPEFFQRVAMRAVAPPRVHPTCTGTEILVGTVSRIWTRILSRYSN